MFKKYIIMLLVSLNIIYAENIYISTEINSSKILLPNLEFTICNVVVGDSLLNMIDEFTKIGYISQAKIHEIPIIDDSQKIFIKTDSDESNIAGYLLLLTHEDFFNKPIIFPSKKSCYKKLFRAKEKYFYSRNMEVLWKDTSSVRVISKISNTYGKAVDGKSRRTPLLYLMLLKDKNDEASFYAFFTMNSINNKLWKMHKDNKYKKFYKILLSKFEVKAKNLNYLDTIAWVYADNNNTKKALKIYENRILPFLNESENNSSEFKRSYNKLKYKE